MTVVLCQTLYYFAGSRDSPLSASSPEPINAPFVWNRSFLPKERQHYRTESSPTTICFPLVLNQKEARWIFDVLGKLPETIYSGE